MNSWFNYLAWKANHYRHRHKIRVPIDRLDSHLGRKVTSTHVESLVIPVVGADYVDEGTLAAVFADRFYPELKEIVVVTDRPALEFRGLPEKAVVRTVQVNDFVPKHHAYTGIFRSRLIKLIAPLQAHHERILMIDSDLMILQTLTIPFADQCLFGCFRRGKMISKVNKAGETKPSELLGTYRPYLWEHLNGAFLAATLSTWTRLSPAWIATYIGIWSKLADNQPPTDQLPLCCALDYLDLSTVDLGDWVNWPVSKKIGGISATVPSEVIGAHGGFPLSEWQRYLNDKGSVMNFIAPEQTRKLRYLTDVEKGGA
jgi:hypothetical protein